MGDWKSLPDQISAWSHLSLYMYASRGEIVEPVPPPLPLDTPLLLVKPPLGLSTPAIFKAFDLELASKADPRQLMESLCSKGMHQDVCINDLERPAFIKYAAEQHCLAD